MTAVRPRLLTKFSKHDIETAFKTAKRVIKTPEIEIRRASQQLDFGRILVIAPRRVGKASIRNKLKRRLKSIFYEEKLFAKGYDLIILIRPGADQFSFQELKALLSQACS
jgi:ribonuclease P protein component